MVEETEEFVQIHVGRTFQKVLLQRVLEIVDSFIRILQKVILEDGLIHVSISSESALKQWTSLACFYCGDGHPVVHEFFIPEPADFSAAAWRSSINLVFPPYSSALPNLYRLP